MQNARFWRWCDKRRWHRKSQSQQLDNHNGSCDNKIKRYESR